MILGDLEGYYFGNLKSVKFYTTENVTHVGEDLLTDEQKIIHALLFFNVITQLKNCLRSEAVMHATSCNVMFWKYCKTETQLM